MSWIKRNRQNNNWYYIQQRERTMKYRQVTCKDGFRMSVQAGENLHSSPKQNSAERYEEVEIGYPSAKESLILEYAENPMAPTDTVYAYVPVDIVTLVIAKHGGMVSGEVPPGVIALSG
jgi:hypothetical protein